MSMAPSTDTHADRFEPPDDSFRRASVLAALFPGPEGPTLLLTKRREDLNHHPGQISFPGGQIEAGETPQAAALREAEEEIALASHLIDLLGPLSPLYISVSNFWVQPFLGILAAPPKELKPQDEEVSLILEVPLNTLAHPDARQHAPWTFRGEEVQVPYFAYNGHTIWGATAMMLAELVTLFDEWR